MRSAPTTTALIRAGAHEAGGHVVADHGGRNAVGHQLPGGEARALQKGPRLIGEDVNVLALLDGRANHAQRRSVAAGGQRAGVAVGEHAAFLGHQLAAECSHGLAGGDVFVVHGVGFGENLRS